MTNQIDNTSCPKTPLLNVLFGIKKWFTKGGCILLGVLIVLFVFFYNPTKIERLFCAIPEEAIVSVYVNSLSKEWDAAMDNNMLMGSASVISQEDLSDLRSNEGLKWTLRLLTGKDSVVAAIDGNGDKEFDFRSGDYLAGATSIGFRRRIMELLWHIKYVPGLGELGVKNGIRYLDFSKHKVGPSPRNPVLALDVVDGMLIVAFTSNVDDLLAVKKRVVTRSNIANVFNITDEPWKLRTSKAIPKNFIVWSTFYDGIVGISSFKSKNLEVRLLDVSDKTQAIMGKMMNFDELGVSAEKIAARYASAEDMVVGFVFNTSICSLESLFGVTGKPIEPAEPNELVTITALSGSNAFELLGNRLPSIHLSTTQKKLKEGDSEIEMLLIDILKNNKVTSTGPQQYRSIYTPKVKGFDLIAANIKFGLYYEKDSELYNMGLAPLNAVKAGTELPVNSISGAYTVGDMLDFFGEECGSSYFIGYCNIKELSKLTNMLQANLKLATMFGVKLNKEDIRTVNTITLVVDKLSEADTLSVGISRIDDKKTINLLKSDEVYCLSLNLTGKDK